MRHARLHRIAPDPLARLRRLRGDDAPADDEVRPALRRLFATDDGKVLLNYMIAQSYGRTLPDNAAESALRANEARKKFLDQILALAEDDSATSEFSSAPRQRRGERSNQAG